MTIRFQPIRISRFTVVILLVAGLLVGVQTLEGTWDGRGDGGIAVAAGVYFLRLQIENEVVTGRVVMLGQ